MFGEELSFESIKIGIKTEDRWSEAGSKSSFELSLFSIPQSLVDIPEAVGEYERIYDLVAKDIISIPLGVVWAVELFPSVGVGDERIS